ncbi:basic secretory protein-like protein [Pseudoalteromonas fenneropenaei]|uniref:Basic secretory protein-like protein n=1 Tax=Pseudoalteromonas fenneropenaei TaxID=1737459 RepID=A0ABV7CHN3_9GAMM
MYKTHLNPAAWRRKLLLPALLTLATSPAFAAIDLTQPNGKISASGENASHESIAKLIDNSEHSKWLTFSPSAWVNYQFNVPVLAKGYSLTSANDEPNRDPQDWVLQGSHNGQLWFELDRQTNQQFSARKQKKTYQFSNTQSYQYLRLNILANHGASLLQIAELELFGNDGSSSSKLPVSDSVSLGQGQWKHYGPFNVNGDLIATTSGTGDADLYLNRGSAATTSNHICASTSPSATETCQANGQDLYVSVYGYSATNYNINIKDSIGSGDGDWKKPVVEFIDVNPETQGSQLVRRILGDPASHMANRCVDVAQILYRDATESNRFQKLRFELRAKDHWGNEFVAYKMGADGSGEMTIVVSTTHLENIYRQGGNSDSTISNEIDGILFHEVTHGYNNTPLTHDKYGDGQANWAYTEGLADAVRILAGYHKTRSPDVNNPKKWLSGYTTTGFFLHYVQSRIDNQFVFKFNKAARDLGNYTWSFDAAFRQTIGRGVDEVWTEYENFIKSGGKLEY